MSVAVNLLKILPYGIALGGIRADLEGAINDHRKKYNIGPPVKLETFTLVYNVEKNNLEAILFNKLYPYPNTEKLCNVIRSMAEKQVPEGAKLTLLACEYSPAGIVLNVGTEKDGEKTLIKHKI